MLFGVWGMAPVRRYRAGKNAQRAVNAKQGHDGSKSRPIDHFAYFPTHEGQMLYRDFLVPRGYSITREAMDASQTTRRGKEFSKPQAPNEIDRGIGASRHNGCKNSVVNMTVGGLR